jgi:nicotinamide riboside kinase
MEKALKQRPSDCLKVVLFGPESTGKTSLCEDLARHYGAYCAREYMRLYLEAKLERGEGPIEKSDLLPIAFGQMAGENRAARSGKLVFCDTDLLQLKVYSQYYYNGYCPKDIRDAALANTYQLYLLCDIDIPWEADPLRDRPFDRLTLFRIFKTELEKNNRPYQLISGGRQHRLQQAVAVIDNLLQPTC